MPKAITIVPKLPKLDRKKRVAAYARVSSGKAAMLHSLSAQISYYNELYSDMMTGYMQEFMRTRPKQVPKSQGRNFSGL